MRSDDLQSEARRRWEDERLQRARSGDRAAFGELYREYAPAIFARVLLPRLGNRAAAEDALAETFRTALERLHQYESRGVSFYFWLARVAVNKATDMHRVKQRTGRALTSLEEMLGPIVSGPDAPHTLLEQERELAALRARMGAALDALNPRYRRAIELRFFDERERQDCADLMEVKLGTFDVLILRALKALRRELERDAGRAEGEGAMMDGEE
ncbi:MAG: RNA polymerase sigma factor [Myxococcales bacterium]|nr:RNA polymerase sigma factor [Myxococcales bacterium]